MGVDKLTQMWHAAVAADADGLTISGGEPLAQAAGLRALLESADRVRRATDREIDFLVYTGYEPVEIDGDSARALRLADAVITGRYDVTRPTRLIWRGSANQRLIPQTHLGRRRYGRYLDHKPERVPMQVAADGGHLWFIGVPRRGDLPRLERALRERGVTYRGSTWRR